MTSNDLSVPLNEKETVPRTLLPLNDVGRTLISSSTAISLNREGMTEDEVRDEIKQLESRFGIPVFDPLNLNIDAIMSIIGH